MARAKVQMGELEAAVMGVLWELGGWCTPGEVHDVLAAERPLAYTTVMTILVRLWKKGRVRRQRDGRAFAYRPVFSREEEVAARMNEVLAKAGDRPQALSFFLESLAPHDRAQLRRMLKDQGSRG
ncbi:MAG TPA: BlaI/MecI/CopY family transcriptional regulator [Acidimicrobiales bacterium]